MISSSTPLKMVASIRRKPGLTRKEFLDYHWQVHGKISDDIPDPEMKPAKYTQIHYFDSVFPTPPPGPFPNQNYSWVGRDDSTELWYRDISHLLKCFSSPVVREKIGPDGLNFNDFESVFSILSVEKKITIPPSMHPGISDDEATVAQIWLARASGSREGAKLESKATPLLVSALREKASEDVYDVSVDIGIVSQEFDVAKYFGGAPHVPVYALVYKVYLTKGPSSVPAFRQAQKIFERALSELNGNEEESADLTKTVVTFGQVGLVLDHQRNIKFENSRQPAIF